MFKGIHDKPSCLDRPVPHSGSNYPPPPITLTSRIHKEILFYRIGGSPYTDSVQPAWLLRPLCCLLNQNQLLLYDHHVTGRVVPRQAAGQEPQ